MSHGHRIADLPITAGSVSLAELPPLASGATATFRVGAADVVRAGNALDRPMAGVALPPLPDPDVTLRWTRDGLLSLRREEDAVKIAFLISTVHDLGGTAGAVVTQANALCERHEVEIISVYRRRGPPLPGRPAGDGHRPGRPARRQGRGRPASTPIAAAALRGRQPTMIEAGSDPTLDALADVALEARAARPGRRRTGDGDARHSRLRHPARARRRTAIVHQEHRSSSQRPNSRRLLLDHARRADVVVMLTEPMARWLAVELGPDAPQIEVVPNALAPAYRPRSPLDRAGDPRRRPAGHREAVDPPDLRVRHGRRPDPRVAGADLRPGPRPVRHHVDVRGSSGSGTGSSAPARPPT